MGHAARGVIIGASALSMAGAAFGAATVFFDRDLHESDTERLGAFPNSQAQRNMFVGSLPASMMFEDDLESIAANTFNPTMGFGGAVDASVTGGVIREAQPGMTDNHGRYPVSGLNYMNLGDAEETGIMTITFSQPISAFGFYGIDIGDFNGTLRLTQLDGAQEQFVVDPISDGGDRSGSMLFWGMIDFDNPFTRIEFFNNTGVDDVFAFDNFIVGLGVPLPAGAGLGFAGLLAGAAMRPRRAV